MFLLESNVGTTIETRISTSEYCDSKEHHHMTISFSNSNHSALGKQSRLVVSQGPTPIQGILALTPTSPEPQFLQVRDCLLFNSSQLLPHPHFYPFGHPAPAFGAAGSPKIMWLWGQWPQGSQPAAWSRLQEVLTHSIKLQPPSLVQ